MVLFVVGVLTLAVWLTGHWIGRVAAFVVGTLAGCFVVAAVPVFAGYQEAGYLAVAGGMWFVSAVPWLLRRRAQAVRLNVGGAVRVLD